MLPKKVKTQPGIYCITNTSLFCMPPRCIFLGNTPAAKDAVQDAFLLAYLQLHQLKNINAFGAWIKKILHHNCYRKLHSYRHYTTASAISITDDNFWENEMERKLELFSKRTQLYEAIGSLAEPLRCTLLLRYFSTFQSYEQIATILCVPVGTVCSRLNQARSRLIEHWKRDHEINENIYKQSEGWSDFYFHHFTSMYESEIARKKLIHHFEKKIEITFTSGKSGAGREYFENEIEDDLHFGTRYQPIHVASCGNISIVEGTNYNPPDCPGRCPESSVFVLFRNGDRVNKLNLYNTPQ